jgi:inosine-uridine nucleoside N-ribohydrolase
LDSAATALGGATRQHVLSGQSKHAHETDDLADAQTAIQHTLALDPADRWIHFVSGNSETSIARRMPMIRRTISKAWLAILLFILAEACVAASRPAAPWPPPRGQLQVIIDTDAANEIDDVYALSLAMGSPDRLHIEGIIAAHFGESGGVSGIDKSYAEIQRDLEKAGLKGRIPVKRGSDPLMYRDQKIQGEGVDFIIEKARSATPEKPLWLVLVGPATDAAAALLKAPEIADRLIVFWHGRTEWPVRAWNFNAYNDILAARLLFELPCRFILFDTGTHLQMDPQESARRFGSVGPLGSYLQEIRHRRPEFMSPRKGLFDLGDIAALVDPSVVRWERTDAPAVLQDLRYDFTRNNGEIVRIYHVESEPTFQLLEGALQRIRDRPGRQ